MATEKADGGEGKYLGLNAYRGIMMNRGARSRKEGPFLHPGVFEVLGLAFEELRGKKVLDVCTGGGRTVMEAREEGIEMYGVDIAPAIDVGKGSYAEAGDNGAFAEGNVRQTQRELQEVVRQYPEAIFGVDAADSLPFGDDYFDVVIVNAGLPGYARNPKEAVSSVLEMLRVAGERVVVSAASLKEDDPEGICTFGVDEFKFAFKSFLDSLERFGISYEIKVQTIEEGFEDRVIETEVTSVHIDTSKKNGRAFNAARKSLIDEADSFLR